MAGKILVVGSINMDLVVRGSEIPRPGQTVLGGEFFMSPGGKGANQAVAVARLGGDCAMLGAVGDDAYGSQLVENLVSAGVDCSLVRCLDDAASGVALITVAESGENSIVVASGANMRVTPADIEAAESAFAEAETVMLQLELPLETVVAAAAVARRNGCRVILDPAPAVENMPDELFDVDVISPNTSEAEIISSSAAGSLDAERAAAGLLAAGAKAAVIKLGAEGCLVCDGELLGRISPFSVSVVDTTAAGDCFTAGLAVALSRGEELVEAARFACAAGALACTKKGAQQSAPTLTEVTQLLQSRPV